MIQDTDGGGQPIGKGLNSPGFAVARSSDNRQDSTTWAEPVNTSSQTTLTEPVPQTTAKTTTAQTTTPSSIVMITLTMTAEGGQPSPSPTQTGDGDSQKSNGAGSSSSPTYKKARIGVGAAAGGLALIWLVAWIVTLLRRRRRRKVVEKQDLRRKMGPSIPPPLTEMGVDGHEAWVPRSEMAVTPTKITPMKLTRFGSARDTGSGMQQPPLPAELATTRHHYVITDQAESHG